MYCLIIIILVREGGGPQPLVYINHSLTTYVTGSFVVVEGWGHGGCLPLHSPISKLGSSYVLSYSYSTNKKYEPPRTQVLYKVQKQKQNYYYFARDAFSKSVDKLFRNIKDKTYIN
jgi:hypothetical protein